MLRGLFHAASALDREDFRTLWDPRDDGYELWAEPRGTPWPAPEGNMVQVESGGADRGIRLFPGKMLETSDRVVVKLRDRDLVVFRTARWPVALPARCPHEGYRLEDGYSDGESIRCPGHGVMFRFRDGASGCGLALRTYACAERDGAVYLEEPVSPEPRRA